MAKGANNTNLPNVITSSTSIGHVLISLVMLVCRKITTRFPIRQRLLAYLAIIFFGGIINDFAPVLIHSILFRVDKRNIINQWGVKIGWFWTCALLAPFMLLTSLIINFGNAQHDVNQSHEQRRNTDRLIKRIRHNDFHAYLELALVGLKTIDFLRLILNTLAWYLSVNFYNIVESFTSNCIHQTKGTVLNSMPTREHCLRAGHRHVSGFDISGHTFLLLFANLLIISECRIMIGWENFESLLRINSAKESNMSTRGDYPSPSKSRQGHQALNQKNQRLEQQHQQSTDHNALYLYRKFTTPIRIMFICLTVLCVIWDFMLIQTALFYHTMIQKLIAALWATAVWYILYFHVYKYVSRKPQPCKQLLEKPINRGSWGV